MVRPRDLALRVSAAQHLETFRLPIDAARRKARQVIDQVPQNGLTSTVENWRQLPDGQIEFAIRYFPAADRRHQAAQHQAFPQARSALPQRTQPSTVGTCWRLLVCLS